MSLASSFPSQRQVGIADILEAPLNQPDLSDTKQVKQDIFSEWGTAYFVRGLCIGTRKPAIYAGLSVTHGSAKRYSPTHPLALLARPASQHCAQLHPLARLAVASLGWMVARR